MQMLLVYVLKPRKFILDGTAPLIGMKACLVQDSCILIAGEDQRGPAVKKSFLGADTINSPFADLDTAQRQGPVSAVS